MPNLVCFAVKSNSNIAVLKLLGDLGAGMDVVSIGEYLRAKAAGVAKVAFDRSGFMYHGRIKALAEAAREAGLEF